MELEALQEVHDRILSLGATLLVISPQQQKYSRQVVNKHRLGYPVLSDPGNGVAKRFGLAHTLPSALQELYASFGIDLPRFNGDQSWMLPLPARFIADKGGRIIVAEAHPDYTRRPEPATILEVLQTL